MPYNYCLIMYNFENISINYDRITTIETLGMDMYWRNAMVKKIRLPKNSFILDAGAGTGKLSNVLTSKFRDGRIYSIDISQKMLDQIKNKRLIKLRADATETDFPDNYFDLAASAFLIRPLNDKINNYFYETHRILKKQGFFIIMEIYEPDNPYFRFLFDFYLHKILRKIGDALTKTDAFSYFSESIREFYSPNQVSELLKKHGFRIINIRSFLSGSIVIHTSIKI